MRLETRLSDRRRWSAGDDCSAAKVLNLLSTKTVFLVVRECFYGTTRFEDFVERVGASAPAISRALKQLETGGVLHRVPYREAGDRRREEYRLSDAGEELLPIFLALMSWGDDHLQDGQPPLTFVHAETGQPVRICVTGDEPAETTSDEIEIRASRRHDPRGRRTS
ncbi:winged helix-turn-helix transcriptional regulator [Williamsia sterculiae]|nr:helix-turn-helix domain-containing protein [Williamsia sterculiae]